MNTIEEVINEKGECYYSLNNNSILDPLFLPRDETGSLNGYEHITLLNSNLNNSTDRDFFIEDNKLYVRETSGPFEVVKPVYKQTGYIYNENFDLFTCNSTGPGTTTMPPTPGTTTIPPTPGPIETFPILYPDTPVPSPQWRFECKGDRLCVPTLSKNLSPNIYDDKDTCLAACGVPEEDKVSNILSIVSLVLASFVLLLMVLLGLFAGDVDTGTTKFFKGLAVFLVITTVILLSVVAYRIA